MKSRSNACHGRKSFFSDIVLSLPWIDELALTLCVHSDSFREIDAFVEHTCTDFGMEKKKVRLKVFRILANGLCCFIVY